MANIFYQGEDIRLDVELFADDKLSVQDSLADSDVQMLFYTRYDGIQIKASTIPASDELLITRSLDTRSVSLVIPASLSKELTPGVLTTEVKVSERGSGVNRISVSSEVFIEPSKIGLQ